MKIQALSESCYSIVGEYSKQALKRGIYCVFKVLIDLIVFIIGIK
jgi:hypothetical protein